MKRREFLGGTAAAAAGLLVFRSSPFSFAQSVGARVEVLLDEPLGTISPNIYGHFVENLSGVIYDGIWVGENSKVPNIGGIRKELVEEMRKISAAELVPYGGGMLIGSMTDRWMLAVLMMFSCSTYGRSWLRALCPWF